MALKSTIYKAELQVADIDRHYYFDHTLTIACHPSETMERMMVRLLAFAINAHTRLSFGRGLSDVDEPDLIRRDLTGAIEQWIEVGQPDERAILKACGKAAEVRIYAYAAAADRWWKQVGARVGRARNLRVWRLDPGGVTDLAAMAERNMRLACTIQDGEVWVRDDTSAAQFTPEPLM
ncbi:MAG: YaeQ family protein [Burkholderiales bacterium]|nr:YaeQ family protein [Burkholderiales bacterium]